MMLMLVLRDPESHVAPHFDHLDLKNTMVPITMLLVSGDDDTGTNSIKFRFIRLNNPTLNQNIGKYNLNHIWDRVLLIPQGLNWALPN